jgi:hypothetical protein
MENKKLTNQGSTSIVFPTRELKNQHHGYASI